MDISSEKREYQICTRCIMDTSDPLIEFDEQGICNHCHKFDQLVASYPLDRTTEAKLEGIIAQIKEYGKEKKYDCIIGVSGGVDSTYVAYLVKRKYGLRPLAVHLDNGWNSELAVSNITNFLKKLDIDLYTHVIHWEEFRDIQLSFLKASVSDAEAPTDHGISALLYQTAIKYGVRYIIGGSNVRSEGVMPHLWTYPYVPYDFRYIKYVQKTYGSEKIRTFPHFSLWQLFYYLYIRKIKMVHLLNYVPYVKQDALRIIEKELEWRNYGGKHYESIYTRFFQAYILPRKFSIDKRKAHYAALIGSGQMPRSEALKKMEEPIAPPDMLTQDRIYVIKKLNISEQEFENIMALPRKAFYHYKTYFPFLTRMKKIARILKKLHMWPESW